MSHVRSLQREGAATIVDVFSPFPLPAVSVRCEDVATWNSWSDNQCQGFKPWHAMCAVLFYVILYAHIYMSSGMALRAN